MFHQMRSTRFGLRSLLAAGLLVAGIGLALLLWTLIDAVALAGNAAALQAGAAALTLRGVAGIVFVGLGFTAMAQRSGFGETEFGETGPVRFDAGDCPADRDVLIRIRCRSCRALNDEHARTCRECDGEL